MRRIHSIIPLLLMAVGTFPAVFAASGDVPAAIAELVPPPATLADGSWGVFDTEFGKTFSADMRATLKGFPLSCDVTIGPDLRVSLKGDTAWEVPPMLDMAVQMFDSDVESARASLADDVAMLGKTNSGVTAVGNLKDEELPAGWILAIEYQEDCARHPKGTNTVLRAFARKGATLLRIDLWISADFQQARAIAVEMLERFQRLDVNALLEAG